MYPKISDFINDVFGTDIHLPVQTYGFFLAWAFIIAGSLAYLELKRKEKDGLISARERTVIKGRPASWKEFLVTGIISFIAGYKMAGIVLEYDIFRSDPQAYIFSSQGSWIAGVILAAIFVYLKYRSKQKQKLAKPVTVRETVHPYQLTGNIILVAAVAGIIGSKIFEVAEHPDDLIRDPMGTLFSFSGLTFYGGLIVAAFAVCFYAEKNGIRWPIIADVVAPSLMIAYGIGRIGCQVSGDGCWGIVNTHPKPEWLGFLPDWMWAYNYPHNVINEGVPITNCLGDHCFILDQPVFPTPFYETVIAITFFTILWSIRKRIKIPGTLFAIYLILNGIERFFIEKIRVNIRYDVAGIKATQAGFIAIMLVLAGIAGIFYFRYRYRKALTNKNPGHGS